MKLNPLILTGILAGLIYSNTWPADNPPKETDRMADISVCNLRYGSYGECISELSGTQVISAPEWNISVGPPPLLPGKAEAIAKAHVAELVAPYANRDKLLLFSYSRTRLIQYDAKHWFYGITFRQRPKGGSTCGWPDIEVFVTFDKK